MSDKANSDVRLAHTEAHLEHVMKELDIVRHSILRLRDEHRTDFRLLFASIVTAALGLSGILARAAGWL